MIVIYIMFNTYTHLIGCTTSKNFQILLLVLMLKFGCVHKTKRNFSPKKLIPNHYLLTYVPMENRVKFLRPIKHFVRLKNNNEETIMAPYSLSSVIVRLLDNICSCQAKSLNSHPVWSRYTSLTARRGCNIASSQINLGSRAAPLAPFFLICFTF